MDRVSVKVRADRVARVSWDSEGPSVEMTHEFLDWLEVHSIEATYHQSSVDHLVIGFGSAEQALLFKLTWF